MSEDPKGFDAGDYNLFRYCKNEPEDLTDPSGMVFTWPVGYSPMDGDVSRAANHAAVTATGQGEGSGKTMSADSALKKWNTLPKSESYRMRITNWKEEDRYGAYYHLQLQTNGKDSHANLPVAEVVTPAPNEKRDFSTPIKTTNGQYFPLNRGDFKDDVHLRPGVEDRGKPIAAGQQDNRHQRFMIKDPHGKEWAIPQLFHHHAIGTETGVVKTTVRDITPTKEE
jgi:hypothetical protein